MKSNCTRYGLSDLARIHALAVSALFVTSAGAAQIETDDPDWAIHFDNTLKASSIYRLRDANPALVDSYRLLVPGVPASAFPQALDFNAGDDNFRKSGVVSKRVDLLSEFDAVYQGNFGVRVSGAAWYDWSYARRSEATDTSNGQDPVNKFPGSTRHIAGDDAEVLDAFVFGGWSFGDGQKVTARLGRHALQYGESLFFGDNGIARAQGPVDINKLLSSPNAQFKEILRPVPQVSAQWQLSPELALGGYYQFRWEADRLPPAGSYFSNANIPWGSQQPQFVGIPDVGNFYLASGPQQNPPNSGQFGGQLKWRLGDTDIGFYAARYSDKDGQLYGHLDTAAGPGPGGALPGTWFYEFPKAVKTYGVSASHSVGDFNLAGEASIRNDMPLRSTDMLYGFFPGQAQPRYATGTTAHANISTLASFGPNFLSLESSLVGELAWNRVLKKDDPDSQLDAGRTRDATAVQFIYTPSYRQVLSGLDLDVPVGVRYSLSGYSSVTNWDPKGSGSVSLGLNGNYLGVWQFTTSYVKYLGKPVPFVDYSGLASGGVAIYGHGNSLADRDYVSISIRRTF